ncbi:hypothetical protein [Cohaesibacter haloalkalitolerans]|uniref:hypothetical protein n=1 Tax=Cohaesibacter haloalkalitolerans TaxID=1162980 RepID=UPI000E6581EF|nr:hypothetical protein [Cohaesibacter haloalkalitolerans]
MKNKAFVLAAAVLAIIPALTMMVFWQTKSFARTKPLLSTAQVQQMEGAIQETLSRTLDHKVYGSEIEVSGCKIISRYEQPQTCSASNDIRFQETLLDIRETSGVSYSSLSANKTSRTSLLKFDFQPDIEQKVKSAKQAMWTYVSEKHGLRGAAWNEFAASAEQRIIKQYGFDKMGSYDMTQSCTSDKKVRHLPGKLGTFVLSGDTRELGQLVRTYYSYCATPAS